MENTRGYVYVMINPSYKDIVKIGKTTKDPEERAKELSSATGVATPFLVVYKRLFNNCNTAEKMLHQILTERGCRVNEAREFFSVSITDAIDLILSIKDSDGLFYESVDTKANNDENNLSEIYYQQANDSYNGNNNTFQDIDKALQLYRKSAELGNHNAWLDMGLIYLHDKSNHKEALVCFHKGSENDNSFCFAELGKIYMNENLKYYNRKNADLAWTNFFKLIDNNSRKLEFDENKVSVYISEFIIYSQIYNQQITAFFEQYISKYLAYIYNSVTHFLKNASKSNLYETKVIPYIDYIEKKYPISDKRRKEISNISFDIAKRNIISCCESEMLKKEKELADSYFSITRGLNDDIIVANKKYEQLENVTLKLLNKSLELGNPFTNAYIGIYWLYKDNNNAINRDKAQKAWKDYYNYVYDTITDKNKIVGTQDTENILSAFFDIFHTAIERKAKDLIHSYYLITAAGLKLVEFYDKRIAELNNLMNNYDKNDINHQMQYCKFAKVDIERIRIVHAYMKEFSKEVAQSGNYHRTVYRLE